MKHLQILFLLKNNNPYEGYQKIKVSDLAYTTALQNGGLFFLRSVADFLAFPWRHLKAVLPAQIHYSFPVVAVQNPARLSE
jgi:hypothetical protein